jgi:serine/threonine-protein kinase
MTPETLGRYQIADRIGQGAMGIVYRARDPIIDRIVALKTIDPHLSGDALREFNQRFFHEAKSAGRLNHPNIVTIHDAGEADGVAYIAMEYLEGPSLRQLLDDHPSLPVSRILEIGAQVARGLAYAHEHGVVHRDVKPANVILVHGRRPKITDFGIARVASGGVAAAGDPAGSPKYMSPEQIRGEALDGRSDLFSLGAVLYELLTGKQPFTGESVDAIVAAVLEAEPPPPSALNPRVPVEVDRVLARMLAKRPEDRYTTARRLMRHLAELADQHAAEEKRRGAEDELPPRPAAGRDGDGDGDGEETTVVLAQRPEVGSQRRGRGLVFAAAAAVAAIALALTMQSRDEPPPVVRADPAPPIPIAAVQPPPVAEAPAAVEPDKPAPAAAAPKPPPAAPKPARKTVAAPVAASPALPDPEPLPKALPATREIATLQLAVSPWGEIFIDGESRGTSPPLASIQVAPGTYRVEVRNSTLVPYRVDVSVGSGDTRRIKHRFE